MDSIDTFSGGSCVCHLTLFKDIFLCLIRYFPDVAVDHLSQDLMTFLLTSICSTHYYKNPYLVSRILEVLYVINPSILESAEALHARFMSHPISEEYLPSALMKFYTGRMASKIIYLTFFL